MTKQNRQRLAEHFRTKTLLNGRENMNYNPDHKYCLEFPVAKPKAQKPVDPKPFNRMNKADLLQACKINEVIVEDPEKTTKAELLKLLEGI